jgi:hypothetical protein
MVYFAGATGAVKGYSIGRMVAIDDGKAVPTPVMWLGKERLEIAKRAPCKHCPACSAFDGIRSDMDRGITLTPKQEVHLAQVRKCHALLLAKRPTECENILAFEPEADDWRSTMEHSTPSEKRLYVSVKERYWQILAFLAKLDAPTTMRELCDDLGYADPALLYDPLKRLANDGLIYLKKNGRSSMTCWDRPFEMAAEHST